MAEGVCFFVNRFGMTVLFWDFFDTLYHIIEQYGFCVQGELIENCVNFEGKKIGTDQSRLAAGEGNRER